MRHVGFIRPVTIGKGQHAATVHHEVVELPERNAAELRRDHPAEVVDLTPKALGFEVFVPRRMSTVRVVPCRVCLGERRMTMCRACGGAGKVVVV